MINEQNADKIEHLNFNMNKLLCGEGNIHSNYIYSVYLNIYVF